LSVGILPCGFGAGIVGVVPIAGSGAPNLSRRHRIAAAPISATTRAKRSENMRHLCCTPSCVVMQKRNQGKAFPPRALGHIFAAPARDLVWGAAK
jgi:hypothetical protein